MTFIDRKGESLGMLCNRILAWLWKRKRAIIPILGGILICLLTLGGYGVFSKTPWAVPAKQTVVFSPSQTPDLPFPTLQPTVFHRPDEWALVDPSGQTVTFWNNYTDDRGPVLNEIIDAFNRENRYGITVIAKSRGRIDELFTQMMELSNPAETPDIVVAYQYQAAQYHLADKVMNLNSLVDSQRWGLSEAEIQDIFPGVFRQDIYPNFADARLGIPISRSVEVMYTNLDWLNELGFDQPPKTPSEFMEMACRASRSRFSRAVDQGNSIGYELPVNDSSHFVSWVFAFGGDIYDSNTTLFTFNSEQVFQAMSFLQNLFKNHCARIVTEQYGDQVDFGDGKVLFATSSSAGVPYFRDAIQAGAQAGWQVGAYPQTGPETISNTYGVSLSIARTTPERELAAWVFLKYYLNPDVQSRWAHTAQSLPVRAAGEAGLDADFNQLPQLRSAFQLLRSTKSEPSVPGYDRIRDEMNASVTAVINGADIRETLNKLNERANQILAEELTSPEPKGTNQP